MKTPLKTKFETTDGKLFDSMNAAADHQKELDSLKTNPEIVIASLRAEIAELRRRITALESRKSLMDEFQRAGVWFNN